MQWLKHAFAVDPPGPAEPTEAQRKVVDSLAREVARRRLATPALMVLEVLRPLNFLTAQTMHFFTPLLSLVTDARGHRELAAFLEQRGAVDYIAERLDSADEAHVGVSAAGAESDLETEQPSHSPGNDDENPRP